MEFMNGIFVTNFGVTMALLESNCVFVKNSGGGGGGAKGGAKGGGGGDACGDDFTWAAMGDETKGGATGCWWD